MFFGIGKLILILGLFLYISFPNPILASNNTLVPAQELKSVGFDKYESINPNLIIFPIKRSIESLKLKLIFNNEDKIKYEYELLDTRFRELVFIINYKKTGFLREAVNRYNSLAGKLILENKNKAPTEKLSTYANVLKTLQDRYDNLSSYRLLIQEAIDTTKRFI